MTLFDLFADCPDPIVLKDDHGATLKTVCYIQQPLNWHESRRECTYIGYRLFEINSDSVANSFFNYLLQVNTGSGSTFWLNGIANSANKWEVVDPSRPYTYSSPSITEGNCFFYYFYENEFFFEAKNCFTQVSYTWCEKL